MTEILRQIWIVEILTLNFANIHHVTTIFSGCTHVESSNLFQIREILKIITHDSEMGESFSSLRFSNPNWLKKVIRHSVPGPDTKAFLPPLVNRAKNHSQNKFFFDGSHVGFIILLKVVSIFAKTCYNWFKDLPEFYYTSNNIM